MSAKAGKAYANVYDLLRGEYPEEPEFAESFLETHKKEEIADVLWMMRTHHGVSQAELAKRLGVSQSKISKIEDHGDSLKFNDVVAYARALGFNTLLEFMGRDVTLAGLIKWHLEAVASHMTELEKLADGDPDISVGVLKHFSNEVAKMLENVLPQWSGTIAELQRKRDSAASGDDSGLLVSVNMPNRSAVLSVK